MKLRYFLLPCTMLFLLPTQAQRHIEVGLSNGLTHYTGDLGNFEDHIQWNGFRPGSAITFRDFLNNPRRYITRSIAIEGRLSWYRIGYDETKPVRGMEGNELRNYGRGLSFRTDLIGASGHVVLNAYKNPYKSLFEQRFFMFFYTGVGVFYGKPKADLFRGDIALENRYHYWSDGTIHDVEQGSPEGPGNTIERDGKFETDLYAWHTEGGMRNGELASRKRYSPWHVAIPMGFGIRWMVTREISVGAEFSYYSFLSDKLDDVSERYASSAEIAANYPNDTIMQQIATYIGDPTGRGSSGKIDETTSPRGNPGLPDAFSYMAFEISYKFKRRPGRRIFVSL